MPRCLVESWRYRGGNSKEQQWERLFFTISHSRWSWRCYGNNIRIMHRCSTLYSTRHCSAARHFTLLYSPSTLLHITLLNSSLLHITSLYSTLLYTAAHHFTLLYCTSPHSTLLCCTELNHYNLLSFISTLLQREEFFSFSANSVLLQSDLPFGYHTTPRMINAILATGCAM